MHACKEIIVSINNFDKILLKNLAMNVEHGCVHVHACIFVIMLSRCIFFHCFDNFSNALSFLWWLHTDVIHYLPISCFFSFLLTYGGDIYAGCLYTFSYLHSTTFSIHSIINNLTSIIGVSSIPQQIFTNS
jgi:hypothetical protein